MLSRFVFSGAVALTLAAGGFVSTAATAKISQEVAVPQVLGLIATNSAVPLTCEDGHCSGFFSAFCMQEERPKPVAGQIYDQVGEGNILIVATAEDGSAKEFSASGMLHIESEGAYTSVKISVPEKRLKSLGAVSVALKVSPAVSLMPVMSVARSQSDIDADLKTALGPSRFVAEGFFESGNPRAQAAAAMTRLINLLPTSTSTSAEQRRGLWRKATSSGALDGLTSEGLDRAKSSYDRCKQFADMGYKVRVRGCLRKDHDQILKHLNKEYWERSAGF